MNEQIQIFSLLNALGFETLIKFKRAQHYNGDCYFSHIITQVINKKLKKLEKKQRNQIQIPFHQIAIMIKTVIQKIIVNSFGQFIKGIEKDKLSVDLFGGNFKLENISLNHEYFDSLNTPFKLAYSSIGKLNITAYLSKLSSVPVECVLDNIYVIFQFRPEVTKETKQEILENQKKSIKKYLQEIFKSYMQKIKDQKKEDGMMAKLGKKIIDNLQMKIVNVHVRFEENRGKLKYGWGLTLEEINLITANNQWQPTFVDREKEGSFNDKLYKKMNVKNLSLYWQTPNNEKQTKEIIIKQYPNDNDKKQKLLSMIQSNKNSIISITSEFKLIMNNPLDEKIPLYELDISLQPIKFQLDRIQVIQMIDFIQKNVVQNQMILRTLKQKKKEKPSSQAELQNLKQQFIDYVDFIIQSQHQNTKKATDLEIYEADKKAIISKIFNFIEMQELMELSINPVKKIIRKIRQEELKKKKRGWFGSADTKLDEKELDQLQKFVQSTFQDGETKKRPQSALFFCINSDIAGGNFKFVDRKPNVQENEVIQFEIGQINFSISKSSDQSFTQMSFSVEQIALGLILPQMISNKYTQKRLQILTNETKVNSSTLISGPANEKFISVVYKKQSFYPTSSQANPQIETTLSVEMQRVIFIYKKLYFKKFKQFFTFKNLNEYMKTTTLQKLQNLKEKEKAIVEEKRDSLAKIENTFLIRINAIAPKIICPLNEKECWCFSFGDLKVESQNKDGINNYPLKINSAYLRYYKDISMCLTSIGNQKAPASSENLEEDNKEIFSVINDMNFSVVYSSNKKLKMTSTQISLPEFQLNFSRTQYQNLLTIKNIFTLDNDEKQTIIEHLKKTRFEIEEQKIHEGFLNVKDQNLGTWKTYYGILAGDFVYLYENRKELKETLKISVTNCSTNIIAKDGKSMLTESALSASQSGKDEEKQFLLELISSQQFCHFSCETFEQLEKWEEEITKKANEFKTINQLMQFYEESDERSRSVSSKHSKKKSTADLSLSRVKRNILSIKIQKIGFKYKDFENVSSKFQSQENESKLSKKMVTLMNFQIHEVEFERIEEENFSSFTLIMSQMTIVDEVFRYKDPQFQTFLMLTNFKLKHQKQKQSKKSLEKNNHKNDKEKHANHPIKNYITIQDLKINWKPDVILIALDLMHKHLSKEEKYRMDDETNKSREDHFNEVFEDTKYMFGMKEYAKKAEGKRVKQKRLKLSRVNKFIKELLTFDIQINHAQAFFIHRESHLVMFRLQSEQIFTEYVLGEHEKFISGHLSTIILQEMTNYPQKTYSSEDELKPFCFAKKKASKHEEGEQKPVLSFYYSSYQPSVLPNQQKVDSFMYLSLQPMEMIYFQQVVFRLIDYSLIQIMLLINQPEMLTVNENLMQQLRRKQEQQIMQKPVKILFSKYEQIIKKLVNPFFMDIYIQVKRPEIIIKAEKNSDHYYEANLQSIVIENRDLKSDKRFTKCHFNQANKYIFQQEYIIKCNHLVLSTVDLGQGHEKKNMLFDPVEMQLVFNKLLFEDQLNIIYPELGSTAENEYDRSFVTNSKMSNIIIPTCSRFQYLSLNKMVNFNFTFDDECDQFFIHNFKVTKLLLPKPIIFTLEVDRVLFNADYEATQNNQKMKLFTAEIQNFRYEYLRKKDLNSQMSINFGDTNIVGYRYESKTFGQKQKLEITQENLIHLKNKKNPKSQWSSEIQINSKTNGEKVIQMTVKSMDVNVKSGLLQLIFQYTLLEDWIFPIVNKIVPELSFYASIEDLNAVLEDDPALLFQTRKKNDVKEIIEQSQKRFMKNSQNLRILKLCGILCYKFYRKKTFSNAHFKELLQTKQMTDQQFEHLPEQTYMSVIVNTQLYHCYKNTHKKRKIMQKFTLNMNEKRYIKVASTEDILFKQAILRDFNVDKCFFKVSVIDLLLFKDVLEIMGIERQYIDFLNDKIGKKNNEKDLSSKNPSNELNTLDSMNINITSLSFYLINSWKQVFIPILNFKIQDLSLSSNNTFKKEIIQGDFSMMLNYFNSLIFKWQPALEKASFSFYKQCNKGQDKRQFAGLESSSPLILNVSKEMFVSMRQTMSAWSTQSKIFENRLKNDSSSSHEPLEFITHYIIRNQTGYAIEICCDQKTKEKLKYKIPNNSQVDHEMQLQDYEEDIERDVIISFKIIHPNVQFKTIGNVSVNAEKQYLVRPKIYDGRQIDAEILIKPINESSKQVLLIGSNKKINEYFDNYCKTTILPFDSPPEVRINDTIYGQKTANIYRVKENKFYKFIGKNGTLTIMPKYLVFNYTPIPLKINEKILKPNEYMGVYQRPLINGQKIKDTILRVEHNQKQGHFYIYCDAYIVDYYGLYFDFGSTEQGKLIKKLYAGSGQKNGYKYFIYVLPQAEFKFRVKINEKSKEHQTLKSAIGHLDFSLRNGNAQCDFSAFCYFNTYKNEHLKEFNRVIEITPRYVLSNTTKDVLKICQKDSLTSMTLRPHERCPFFWQNAQKPKQIKIALCKDNQMWGYSGALQLKKSCETFVLRNSLDRTQYRILSIHVQQTNTITLVHIFEAPSKYKIANQIKGTLITVYQSCLSEIQAENQFMSPYECVFNVKYGEEKQFGYELPLQSHALTIQVQLDTNLPKFANKIAQPIMIEDLQSNLYVKKIPLINAKTNKQQQSLTLVLEFEGNIKKLKLVEEEKEVNNEVDYEYSIKLASFGVSLIGLHDEFRREIVFLLLNGVDLRLTGNEDVQGYELVVQNLRVENQLKQNVAFPTILEAHKTKNANFFLQFMLNRDARNSKFIRSIGLAINRTIITVTSEELQALQQNLQEIFSIKINLQKERDKQMIREYELFKKQEKINVQQSYYFEEAEIQPLKIVLTFKHVNNWGGRLLKTFSSMNQSMISVDGKKMRHFNAPNIGVFLKSVQQSYKDQIFKTILPLIGNLTILGSPVSLVQKIGSGFKDLIQLPAEEFENGPLGIGKGIAKGTKSLVKNTFQGAMNTVESFTGSLGNGLTALVDDEQFEKKRQKIKNERTEHVGEGLKHGAKSIFNGFSKGITGLITQPVRGAEKDGLPGFFLGGLKGITGLVIKPVSGILDATTKTAEGIKNTANFLSPNEREKRLKRMHKPRPFYNHCRDFRTYDPDLAELNDFLQKHGNAKGPFGWVGYFNLKSNQKKMFIVLLSYEYLVFLDFKRRQIVCEYRTQDLVQAVRIDNFKFRLVIQDKKKQNKEGHIDLQTQSPNHKIIKQINKLVKFYRPKFTFE